MVVENVTAAKVDSDYAAWRKYTLDDIDDEMTMSHREIALKHLYQAKWLMAQTEFPPNFLPTIEPLNTIYAKLHIEIANTHLKLRDAK
jgi:hypothetical protein